ncbi:AAA family ATPase [Legionella sp. D16C41]|uniref:AAA family ATPase n=1 Tax=Legionella sp. D16C41 TaxID=3402688 RepID=UPI003AF89717
MIKQLQDALSDILLGKEEVISLGITCLLANGNLLLEDSPGMGKTTFSHALAQLTGMQYRRIQFTSDLLPSDLLGVSIFDSQKRLFNFHHGPIFAQLILADEINRAPPKTQSALLEAMEEKQITTDAGTELLPEPFFVIATQNPSHHIGTYDLPESQLDRFLMRLTIGYPPPAAERQILKTPSGNKTLIKLMPVMKTAQLIALQKQSEKVVISDVVLDYVQALLTASRNQEWFVHGLSPRAGKGIVRAAQAYALIHDRPFTRPDDIQAILSAVVNHRLIIKKAHNNLSAADLLIDSVKVPI